MKLTRDELKKIIINELRIVLKEFKMPDDDVDVPTVDSEGEYNQIQPASHEIAQAELQRQCAIKQGR